ncbi:MAG: 2-C-methyl-D-erythritol 4-phosphate cytidylyltransferase [Sphaerochaetaceae bacterium]|jgi:2-C-methyl-D-erythritol 4-phosphate cytidylyltransferase/2-C-methyl-D-erythritol 4-phosphate cytidylyltransferase/2-C-methyl-D-erythritol 2,4-cyclodiphosphate synthase|nr:2-C-methyl-D-erythritol 4-phosphate cytidylyltransferase [Sphaerochaetaceae bacterium]
MAFPPFAVVITAAGKSERFNNNNEQSVKKEYLKIEGHTVLYRSIVPFLEVPNLQAIIVTSPVGLKEECIVALEELGKRNPIPLIITDGGDSRQQSVRNALELINNLDLGVEYVAIHDGARCFVTPDLIISTLATATVYGASAPAQIITDSVKEVDQNGVMINSYDRKSIVTVQTPQIFRFPEILYAHQSAKEDKQYYDDTEIFAEAGLKVGVSMGDPKNKKITYLSDIPDAERQIKEYIMVREEGLRKGKIDKQFRSYVNNIQPPAEN